VNLSRIAANYILGNLLTEDLPTLAIEALQAGYDSPSLRQLAASEGSQSDEIRKLFSKALEELKINAPSLTEAGLMLAQDIAKDIVMGRIAPYEGAKRIWWDVFTRFPQLTQLTPFVGLASEYEDDEQHRGEYSRQIMEESRKLLAN